MAIKHFRRMLTPNIYLSLIIDPSPIYMTLHTFISKIMSDLIYFVWKTTNSNIKFTNLGGKEIISIWMNFPIECDTLNQAKWVIIDSQRSLNDTQPARSSPSPPHLQQRVKIVEESTVAQMSRSQSGTAGISREGVCVCVCRRTSHRDQQKHAVKKNKTKAASPSAASGAAAACWTNKSFSLIVIENKQKPFWLREKDEYVNVVQHLLGVLTNGLTGMSVVSFFFLTRILLTVATSTEAAIYTPVGCCPGFRDARCFRSPRGLTPTTGCSLRLTLRSRPPSW